MVKVKEHFYGSQVHDHTFVIYIRRLLNYGNRQNILDLTILLFWSIIFFIQVCQVYLEHVLSCYTDRDLPEAEAQHYNNQSKLPIFIKTSKKQLFKQ